MNRHEKKMEEYSIAKLQELPYRYLQQIAKSMNLPANVMKIHMVEMIYAVKTRSSEEVAALVKRIRQMQRAKRERTMKRKMMDEDSTTSSSESDDITISISRKSKRYRKSLDVVRYPQLTINNFNGPPPVANHSNALQLSSRRQPRMFMHPAMNNIFQGPSDNYPPPSDRVLRSCNVRTYRKRHYPLACDEPERDPVRNNRAMASRTVSYPPDVTSGALVQTQRQCFVTTTNNSSNVSTTTNLLPPSQRTPITIPKKSPRYRLEYVPEEVTVPRQIGVRLEDGSKAFMEGLVVEKTVDSQDNTIVMPQQTVQTNDVNETQVNHFENYGQTFADPRNMPVRLVGAPGPEQRTEVANQADQHYNMFSQEQLGYLQQRIRNDMPRTFEQPCHRQEIKNDTRSQYPSDTYRAQRDDQRTQSVMCLRDQSARRREMKRVLEQSYKQMQKPIDWRMEMQSGNRIEQQNSKRMEEQNSKRIEQQNSKRMEQQNSKRMEEQNSKRMEEQNSKRIEQQNSKRIEQQNSKRMEEQNSKRIEQQNSKRIEQQNSKRMEEQNSKRMEEQKSKRLKIQNGEQHEVQSYRRLEKQSEQRSKDMKNDSDKKVELQRVKHLENQSRQLLKLKSDKHQEIQSAGRLEKHTDNRVKSYNHSVMQCSKRLENQSDEHYEIQNIASLKKLIDSSMKVCKHPEIQCDKRLDKQKGTHTKRQSDDQLQRRRSEHLELQCDRLRQRQIRQYAELPLDDYLTSHKGQPFSRPSKRLRGSCGQFRESQSGEYLESQTFHQLELENGEYLKSPSGERLELESGEYLKLPNGEFLKSHSGERLELESGEYLKSQSSERLELESGEYLKSQSGERLELQSGEYLKLPNGEFLKSHSGERLELESGEYLKSQSSERLELQSGEYLKLPNGEYLKSLSGERLELECGEYLKSPSGERLELQSGEYLKLPNGEYLKSQSAEYLASQSGEYLKVTGQYPVYQNIVYHEGNSYGQEQPNMQPHVPQIEATENRNLIVYDPSVGTSFHQRLPSIGHVFSVMKDKDTPLHVQVCDESDVNAVKAYSTPLHVQVCDESDVNAVKAYSTPLHVQVCDEPDVNAVKAYSTPLHVQVCDEPDGNAVKAYSTPLHVQVCDEPDGNAVKAYSTPLHVQVCDEPDANAVKAYSTPLHVQVCDEPDGNAVKAYSTPLHVQVCDEPDGNAVKAYSTPQHMQVCDESDVNAVKAYSTPLHVQVCDESDVNTVKDYSTPLHVQVCDESDALVGQPVYKITNHNGPKESQFSYEMPTYQPLLQVATPASTPGDISRNYNDEYELIWGPPAELEVTTNGSEIVGTYELITEASKESVTPEERHDGAEGENKYQQTSHTADTKRKGQIEENLDDAYEIISQDGEYQVGIQTMQCILCSWAGPKICVEDHIRAEHEEQIQKQNNPNWNIIYKLGSLVNQQLWLSHVSEYQSQLFIISIKYEDPDCLMVATSTLLSYKEGPKLASITIYNRASGEPYEWKGPISTIDSDMPYKNNMPCLKLQLSKLDLLPNSANLKLINRELVLNSNSKVIVGQPILNDIHINIFFYLESPDA